MTAQTRARLLVLFLVVASLPRIAAIPPGAFGALGISVNLNLYQMVVLSLGIGTLLFRRDIWQNDSLVWVGRAVAIIAVANLARLVLNTYSAGGPDADAVAVRGTLAALINISFLMWIAASFADLGRERAARAIVAYGAIVATSGAFEFALARLHPGWLVAWRELVFGGTVQRSDILRVGGVTLNASSSVVRVGGIIGAPENLGLVLALTLPALALAPLSQRTRRLLCGLYLLALVVTASRSLFVGMAVYLLVYLWQRRRNRAGQALFLAALVVTLALGVQRVNPNVASRASGGAVAYEVSWRGQRTELLLESSGNNRATARQVLGSGIGLDTRAKTSSGSPAAVTTGVLGGDFLVAWLYGGLVGLVVLATLWVALLRQRGQPGSAVAWPMMVIVIFSASLFEPVLMQIALTTTVISVLIFAIPLLLANVDVSRSRADRVAFATERA